MAPHSSFSLTGAIKRVERFYPLSPTEMKRLVDAIHAELDEIAAGRGDVIEFAKRGEIGPRKAKNTILEL